MASRMAKVIHSPIPPRIAPPGESVMQPSMNENAMIVVRNHDT